MVADHGICYHDLRKVIKMIVILFAFVLRHYISHDEVSSCNSSYSRLKSHVVPGNHQLGKMDINSQFLQYNDLQKDSVFCHNYVWHEDKVLAGHNKDPA